MLIGALWVLEQEQKFYESHFGPPTQDTSAAGAALGVVMAGAIFQTGAIGGMPYRSLIRWVGHEDAFLRLLKLHSPRSLGGKGIPTGFRFGKGILGFQTKWMTASLGRRLAAKAATRFVPYVGWALFATDIYFSAKWIRDKWMA